MAIDSMEAYVRVPERFSVLNLSTDEEVIAQLNPTEFEESISANWNRLGTPGASRQHMHFSNTDNGTVSLELYFRAANEIEYDNINKAKYQIKSWCYPQAATSTAPGKGPPVLLATWPMVFSIDCVLLSCTFKNKRFAPDGRCTMFTAQVKFEECSDGRLTSEDIVQASVVRGLTS
jgi:hypothetical protein